MLIDVLFVVFKGEVQGVEHNERMLVKARDRMAKSINWLYLYGMGRQSLDIPKGCSPGNNTFYISKTMP